MKRWTLIVISIILILFGTGLLALSGGLIYIFINDALPLEQFRTGPIFSAFWISIPLNTIFGFLLGYGIHSLIRRFK